MTCYSIARMSIYWYSIATIILQSALIFFLSTFSVTRGVRLYFRVEYSHGKQRVKRATAQKECWMETVSDEHLQDHTLKAIFA